MKESLLSTRQNLLFKIVSFLPWLALFTFTIHTWWIEGFLEALPLLGFLVFFPYKVFIKIVFKIQSISFDKEYLYINNSEQDVLIPLYQINSVELKTLTGIHKIKLASQYSPNDIIYFKSSMWYPLNFKKVDNRMVRLRKNITIAKQTGEENYHLASTGL